MRKRDVPWFKVFAANDMASARFYGLSVGERGLLDSMQRCCWNDGSVPRNARLLARVVRLEEIEVKESLTDAVLAYFVADEHDAEMLRSIEIDRQLDELAVIREKQRKGGMLGARITNSTKVKILKGKTKEPPLAAHATIPAPTHASRDRLPSIPSNQIPSNASVDGVDPWVREYEDALASGTHTN